MPDTISHHTDMIHHEPNKLPDFWWLNPWAYARDLKQALDAVHEMADFEAAAYENAKTLIKQKDEQIEYHRKRCNDFHREVAATLIKEADAPTAYENTIDLVRWACDAIKTLRKDRDEAYRVNKNVNEAMSNLTSAIAAARVATPDTCLDGHGPESWMKNTVALLDRVVNERDALRDERNKLADEIAELKDKCRFIHGVHKGDVCGNHEPRIHAGEAPDLDAFRFGHTHVHEKPKAKRKPKARRKPAMAKATKRRAKR